jgi:hypothetical protein
MAPTGAESLAPVGGTRVGEQDLHRGRISGLVHVGELVDAVVDKPDQLGTGVGFHALRGLKIFLIASATHQLSFTQSRPRVAIDPAPGTTTVCARSA